MMSEFIILELVEHSGLSMRSISLSFSISLSPTSKHHQKSDSHWVLSHNFHRHVLTLLPAFSSRCEFTWCVRTCNYNGAKIGLWLPVHTQSMKILLQLLSVHCTKVTISGSNSITSNISAEQTPGCCECKKLLVCTGARDFWHLIKTHELEQNPTRKPCNASNL